MDCDAPTITAGNYASAANAAQAQAQLAPVQQLAKSVGLLGSLDLLGALTAAGASGDFGSYMLDAGTGMEQDVAAFAVSVFFLGEPRHLVFFFSTSPLSRRVQIAETVFLPFFAVHLQPHRTSRRSPPRPSSG